jgi:hypothetical protein
MARSLTSLRSVELRDNGAMARSLTSLRSVDYQFRPG